MAAPAAAARCTVTQVTTIDFGVYQVSSSVPLDSTGELVIECDETTSVQIHLGRGRSARQSPRELRYRNRGLAYDIYLDAAHTRIWGDGTGGTRAYSGVVVAGRALRIPMFARIHPRQAVPAGSYRDRIVLSVVF